MVVTYCTGVTNCTTTVFSSSKSKKLYKTNVKQEKVKGLALLYTEREFTLWETFFLMTSFVGLPILKPEKEIKCRIVFIFPL